MRFYRALLRLYPAVFRAEYGEELCAAFAERRRGLSAPRAVLAALADVVPNAFAVHLDVLRQDLTYAARTFRRLPGFTLTAIAVVALGVGANTAAFSLVDFVLLRPLPFPQPDRLVKLWQQTDGYNYMEPSPAAYRDWKAMAKTIRGMGAYTSRGVNLVGVGTPLRLQSALVTPDLLPLIGVPAHLGSTITAANSSDGTASALLSHALWRDHFGADPGIVGRTVRLNGAVHTIVGVMPAGFLFPNRGIDLWTPLVFSPEDFEDRNDNYLEVVGRLAPGVTFEQARAELDTIATRLNEQYPDESGQKTRILAQRLRDQMPGRTRVLVLALSGAALCILLLACANLASLLLARGAARSRELAIRTALGAGRDRLVRQLITESVLLAVMGGLLGILIARAGLPLLAALVPASLPIQETPTIDLRVLAFAAVLIGLTGLGFGVLPALRQGHSTVKQRVRSALVVVEITGSIVLLIASGLLMRAIWRIHAVDAGFDARNVTTMRTALPLPKYATVAARDRFYDRVLQEVRALPGIDAAAYTTGLPIDFPGGIWPVVVDGANAIRTLENSASLRYVTPGYFAAMGIPLRAGRDIAEGDTVDRPHVAVVSESFVQRHWPGQDPIGRRFGFALSERTVVGVVGDVRVRGLERPSEPQVYVSSAQVADNAIIGYIPQDLVVRTSLPLDRWLPSVRRIIAAADPEQPVSRIRTLTEVVEGDTAPRRVQLRLLAILSAIALLIGGVGIHGLLSFAVAQRTRELGIRRALGAQAGSIVAMVMREGLQLAILGAAIGVVVSLFVGRSLSAVLFGVPPTDIRTIALAVAVCLLTAVLGCLRPALRAARVDPMTALREG
ncbi:MAG TPA: ABC transporter permease [Thermoanaerobaculia bacterium]|jgi:predicted permease